MLEHWTVGRRIAVGFGAVSVLVAILALMSIYTLNLTVERKDFVIENLMRNEVDAAHLFQALTSHATAKRSYLVSQRQEQMLKAREQESSFQSVLQRLSSNVITAQGKAFVALAIETEGKVNERLSALELEAAAGEVSVIDRFNTEINPLLETWEDAWISYDKFLIERTEQKQAEAEADVERARTSFFLLGGFAIAISVLISGLLTRYVAQRVGSAVAQLQSTSAELQTAANQQATSSREQTTAMNEVSTTLKELVATARQMAETTQRVSRAADDTVQAAKVGDRTVGSAQSVLESVQRQVNLIVSHMVELGKKSQQIGAIQELINELAEQTNILSINATIESAGAGEAGKRFAVVAEEIRKLADRVAASGREIRNLVDEIRSAANTTVMVTEDGSKAVDAGMHSFSQVASSLSEIRRMVDSASEASRQIELGTRQQVTAVEQVNLTLADLTQAAKESDAGTRQTLEGVEYLNRLALDLVRMTGGRRG